jgi:hypothetical protein
MASQELCTMELVSQLACILSVLRTDKAEFKNWILAESLLFLSQKALGV